MAHANPAHAVQPESKKWTLQAEDNFTYLEYTADEITVEDGKAIVDEWVPLITNPDVDTHVLVLDSDGYIDKDTFETFNQAGQLGLEHGVENWVIVARKTKAMAIASKLPDEIETADTDDPEEARELARE